MAYATNTELKTRLNKTGAGQDALLTALIDAASIAVNNYCNRPDGFEAVAVATARTYMGSGKPYQWIDECIAITAVAVKNSLSDTTYTAWAAADYIKASGDPKNPNFNRLPYTMLITDPNGDYSIFTGGGYSNLQGFPPDIDAKDVARGVQTVQVTARWGYSATAPTPIREATLIQAVRLYKRFESGMSDTLASSDLGQLMYTQPLDPDAIFLLKLGRYIRPPVG